MFDFLKNNKVGIFVDGPNMLRKEMHLDLAKVKRKAKKMGNVIRANVYLDQFANEKLIEAVINQGFEPIQASGDIDVAMAVDLIYYPIKENLGKVVIVTRDTDFVPAIRRLKELGKEIIVISKRFGFSSALKNYADQLIYL